MRTIAIAIALVLLAARTAGANDCVAGDTSVSSARIGSDGVVVCYDRCWRLDYASHAWTVVEAPEPEPKTDAPAPGPKIALATKLHVCDPDCRDLTLPGVAVITERDVTESADRRLLAVHGPANDKDTPVYVFDAVAGTLRATIHPWKTGMGDPASFQRIGFIGGALFVAVSASPVCSAGRLYDPRTGRQLAEIGGRDAVIDESVALDLGGNRWAFAAFDAGELYVHDVATGKRLPSIRSGPKDGGYDALQLAGKLLVGVRGTARGGVMLYDVGQRKASHHAVPACK
ncbi:MAG TPA: hypothetical protein VH165_02455 [Kofleriaceae bacterium]|nr:hypothetical protein [Kofleriaceae bacterium]